MIARQLDTFGHHILILNILLSQRYELSNVVDLNTTEWFNNSKQILLNHVVVEQVQMVLYHCVFT